MRYRTLFVDVGGVLLSNGWDTPLRNRTAEKFHLDPIEMESRHQMVFEDFERGYLSLNEYLHHIIFYKPRSFSQDELIAYIFDVSTALPGMIELVNRLKSKYDWKVALLSNEGAEIATNRIKKFDLKSLADYFIVSGYVGYRKPDLRIYQLALGLSQTAPNAVIYIDDRKHFVEIARSFGIFAIHHVDYSQTQKILESSTL